MNFRRDIQGIRAIAVLFVVIAHSNLGVLPGGFIGVDIFFVISGYLITGLLTIEYKRSSSIGLINFAARRLKRLLPALAVVIIGVTAACFVLLSPLEFSQHLRSAPFASAWLSNIYFQWNEIHYFDVGMQYDIFLHTWSLGVEEQFYLIWPLLILALLKTINSSKKPSTSIETKLAYTFVFFTLLSFSLSILLHSIDTKLSFYMMPARLWQFSFGAIIFCLESRKLNDSEACQTETNALPHATSYLSILTLIFCAVFFHEKMEFKNLWVAIPTLATGLLIYFNRTAGSLDSILTNKLMVWTGDRSYSIYLWHWPIIILTSILAIKSILSIFGAIVLTVILSVVTYKYVEQPLRKSKRFQSNSKRLILVSLLSMSLMILLTFSLLRDSRRSIESANWSSAMFDAPVIYNKKCDDWYHSATLTPCTFGSEQAKHTAVLMGDSIGVQWFSAIERLFNSSDWRVIVLTKSSCPMVDQDFYYKRIEKVYENCTIWRNSAIKFIQQLSPDVIFLGSSNTYDFEKNDWIDGSKRIFSSLSKLPAQVYIINGTPSLGFSGPNCLMKQVKSQDISLLKKNCSSPIKPRDRLVLAYLKQASSEFSNVSVLNLNNSVCESGICSAISKEGIAVYRDSQHVTDTFAKTLAPKIKAQLNNVTMEILNIRQEFNE